MNSPATVLHLGPLLITLPNLIAISLILVLFVAALVLPFPHQRGPRPKERTYE